MNLAQKAYSELYPEKKPEEKLSIKYSRAFNPYNANVKYTRREMVFSLSDKWKSVSDEIKIGLIQSLLLKVFKPRNRQGKKHGKQTNRHTINIDLYENFLRNIGDYTEAGQAPPLLKASFDRVNRKYFKGFIEQPNLKWGNNSFSRLGTYEYGSNTVTLSAVLEDDSELLDYVMYHELLHKKHKFKSRNTRSYHHTPEFKRDEKKFENPEIEKKLEIFLKKKHRRKLFRFF